MHFLTADDAAWLAALDRFLADGGDINACWEGGCGEPTSMLLDACRRGLPARAAALLERRADPNMAAPRGGDASQPRERDTPLMAACVLGDANVATVELLVRHGARADARDGRRWDALRYACQARAPALIAADGVVELACAIPTRHRRALGSELTAHSCCSKVKSTIVSSGNGDSIVHLPS